MKKDCGAAQDVISALGSPVHVVVDRNGKRIDFTDLHVRELAFFDLSGYDLRNVDWSRIYSISDGDLSGALINGEDWSKIQRISRVDMSGIKISGGTLKTQLSTSKLRGAHLRNVKFSYQSVTNMFGRGDITQWEKVDASGCLFENVRFEAPGGESILKKCDLSNATFENSRFNNHNFSDSNFKNVTAKKTFFSGCVFEFTDMRNTSFKDCEIEIKVTNSRWSDSVVSGCSLKNSELYFPVAPNKKKKGRRFFGRRNGSMGYRYYSYHYDSLREAKKTNEDIQVVNKNLFLEDTTIVGTQLVGNFKDVRFVRCSMESTNFSECDISGNNFSNTTFKLVGFFGVTAVGVNWADATFVGVKFSQKGNKSNLSKSDFRGCKFVDTQVGNSVLKKSKWDRVDTAGLEVFPDAQHVPIVNKNEKFDFKRETHSYEHYSFADVKRRLGGRPESVKNFLIENNIDVRDNFTKLRVAGNFNEDSVHVPVWAFQNISRW